LALASSSMMLPTRPPWVLPTSFSADLASSASIPPVMGSMPNLTQSAGAASYNDDLNKRTRSGTLNQFDKSSSCVLHPHCSGKQKGRGMEEYGRGQVKLPLIAKRMSSESNMKKAICQPTFEWRAPCRRRGMGKNHNAEVRSTAFCMAMQ